jgi:hypothetical protein
MTKEDTVFDSTSKRIEYDFDKSKINAVRFLSQIAFAKQNGDGRMTLDKKVLKLGILDGTIAGLDDALKEAKDLLSGFLNFRQFNQQKKKLLSAAEESRYLRVTRIYDWIGEEVGKQIDNLKPHEKAVWEFAYPHLRRPVPGTDKEEVDWQAFRELVGFFRKCKLEVSDGPVTQALSGLVGQVYDVHRWAAPTRNRNYSGAPRFIRAALRFNKPTAKNGFFGFELLYRPYMTEEVRYSRGEVLKSTGRVLAIGEHLYFLGHEDANNYPIIICCHLRLDRLHEFTGLVLRRKENESTVFTSRVHFRRNEESSVDFEGVELKNKLCITYYEENTDDEEIKKIHRVLDELRNLTDFDGRSALELLAY